MSATLKYSPANPLRMVITSWANRNANDKEYKRFREYSFPGFDSYFQPFLQTDTLTIQWQSSFSTNTATLKNYKTGATVSSPTVTLIATRSTYSVYQTTINISSLDGLYYLECTGSTGGDTYTAVSEPFEVRPTFCNTVLLNYRNSETAFGVDYNNSDVQFNLRVYAFFHKEADEKEQEVFTDTGNDRSLISSRITQAREFKLSVLTPDWVIKKINIALSHDTVSIDGLDVSGNQAFLPFSQISNKALWSESSTVIQLAENELFNVYDQVSDNEVNTVVYTDNFDSAAPWTLGAQLVISDGLLKIDSTLTDGDTTIANSSVSLQSGKYVLTALSRSISQVGTSEFTVLSIRLKSGASTLASITFNEDEDNESKSSSETTSIASGTYTIEVEFEANDGDLTTAELDQITITKTA